MASKPAATTTRTSSCLCGSVNITFTGQDKGVRLCHCNNCKSQSGSAFMQNHAFTKADIDVTKGSQQLRQYADGDTKSGTTLYRHFCSNCGSALYLTNSKFKGFVGIAAGNMKEERRQPTSELFLENKYAWIGNVTSQQQQAKL